jgi:hypothetical protein
MLSGAFPKYLDPESTSISYIKSISRCPFVAFSTPWIRLVPQNDNSTAAGRFGMPRVPVGVHRDCGGEILNFQNPYGFRNAKLVKIEHFIDGTDGVGE